MLWLTPHLPFSLVHPACCCCCSHRFFYASSACIYPEHKQLETEVEGGGLKEGDAWPAQVCERVCPAAAAQYQHQQQLSSFVQARWLAGCRMRMHIASLQTDKTAILPNTVCLIV
jgi:hypothetical protein